MFNYKCACICKRTEDIERKYDMRKGYEIKRHSLVLKAINWQAFQ